MPQGTQTTTPSGANGAASTQEVRRAALGAPVVPGTSAVPAALLTDEEILGMDEAPVAPAFRPAGVSAVAEQSPAGLKPARPVGGPGATQADSSSAAISPEEAQAIAQLFPGGAEAARAAAAGADQLAKIDVAYFGSDPGAQAHLAEYLYSAEPRAFAAMVEHAARVLAQRDPAAYAAAARAFGGPNGVAAGFSPPQVGNTTVQDGALKGAPTQEQSAIAQERAAVDRLRAEMGRERQALRVERFTAFQQSANDTVVAQVKSTLDATLARTLPESTSADARQRIAQDIFLEVHHALAQDRALSHQVASVIAQERYDDTAREQVAAIVLTRARAVLPEVTRRVVGAWTSGVVAAHRQRSDKQDAAAGRIELAGGAPDSVTPRALTSAQIRRMSDEEILNY